MSQDEIVQRLQRLETDVSRIKSLQEETKEFFDGEKARAGCTSARLAAEGILTSVCRLEGLAVSPKAALDELIKRFNQERNNGNIIIPGVVMRSFETIQRFGNETSHYRDDMHSVNAQNAMPCLNALTITVHWFLENYIPSNHFKPFLEGILTDGIFCLQEQALFDQKWQESGMEEKTVHDLFYEVNEVYPLSNMDTPVKGSSGLLDSIYQQYSKENSSQSTTLAASGDAISQIQQDSTQSGDLLQQKPPFEKKEDEPGEPTVKNPKLEWITTFSGIAIVLSIPSALALAYFWSSYAILIFGGGLMLLSHFLYLSLDKKTKEEIKGRKFDDVYALGCFSALLFSSLYFLWELIAWVISLF